MPLRRAVRVRKRPHPAERPRTAWYRGLFEIACLIQMAVESSVVSDDEILARCGGALDDIERGHHGDGDSGNGCVGIAGLEGVNSRLTPRHANILLNPFNDGLSSELRLLCD